MNEESGLLVIKSMDKKLATGELKTEFNNSMANSAFSDQIPASFDMQSFDSDMGFNYSCFVDILGSQDFTFSSDLSDLFQPAAPQPPPAVFMVDQSKVPVFSPATTLLESSEVVNTPATPNSSSISSSFNQNVDLQKKAIDGAEVEDPKETMKQTMKKKAKKEKKKEREPRFAFRTKCEVDNLDDGYRWRKYGQKAVKNSPFPRSYYRCTTPQCDVKKRVERSVEDNTILVTTYEGTHIHPCPSTTPRGGGVTAPPVEAPYSFLLGNTTTGVSGLGSGATTRVSGLGGSGNGVGGYLPSIQYHQPQHYQQQQQQSFLGGQFASTFNFNTVTNNSSLFDHHDLSTRLVEDQERRFSGPSSNPIFMDGGLLEDMVTPQMLKKPKVEY